MSLDALHATLDQRKRPEDVAEMIFETLGATFSQAQRAILEKAAQGSLKRRFWQASSMMEDFHRPVAPERQVRKALELFRRTEPWTAAECADPQRVEAFIRELGALIVKQIGESDFKTHRLNGDQRSAKGLDLSRRRYNKLFRFLARLESKLRQYVREIRKSELTRVGKSRFASRLSREEFSRDPASAAFIAYYAARSNLRSIFTNDRQQHAYDEISDMLFARLREQPSATNWWAVAHVHLEREVLDHLTDEQRGRLLGLWLATLRDVAGLLEEVWAASPIESATMIVRRGNDSSTWNQTANAWNKARSAWIALLHSMGMQEELEALCLGKVLRLIAADVAAWHQASGKTLDTDTLVWNELPRPWEVLAGRATCTRADVEQVCRRHGVDPVQKGWIAPPPERLVEKFQPTPELVHGVVVSDPALALILRKAGWFSGKWGTKLPVATGPVTVQRDPHGFALGAGPTEPLTQSPPRGTDS
jgi:hypothetical protein